MNVPSAAWLAALAVAPVAWLAVAVLEPRVADVAIGAAVLWAVYGYAEYKLGDHCD